MKKLLVLVMVLLLAFSTVACGEKAPETEAPQTKTTEADKSSKADDSDPFANGETITIAIASGAKQGTVAYDATYELEAMLEEVSGGKIQVDAYPANQIGADNEALEGLQSGDIAMWVGQIAAVTSFVPQAAVYDMPMVFTRDVNNNQKVFAGDLLEQMKGFYKTAGFHLFGYSQNGTFREMSSKHPAYSVEDLKGLKMRTMTGKYHVAFWNAAGTGATPLSGSETYLALEQGVVDAEENAYGQMVAAGYTEVQDYIINTDHILYTIHVLFSEKQWENLPDGYAEVIEATVQKWLTERCPEALTAEDQNFLQQIKDAGLEVIEWTDEEKVKLRNQAATVVYDMVREEVSAELVDQVLETLGIK